MRWALYILLGLLPAAVFGAVEDELFEDDPVPTQAPLSDSPRDSLRFSGELSRNGIVHGTIEPTFQLSDEWKLSGSLGLLQSGPGLSSMEARFGAEGCVPGIFCGRFVPLFTDGPQALRGTGGLLRAKGWLNRIWGSKNATILRSSTNL